MKMISLVFVFVIAVNIFASDSKIIVFGMQDRSANEYKNENISRVTYKAWLIKGSGPTVGNEILRSTDGLSQSCTTMFPDSVESPMRGVSMIDLQHFPVWAPGNILYIYMRDENYGDAEAYYTIQETGTEEDYVYLDAETGVEWVLLGFEDCFGLQGSGNPYWLAIPAGSVPDAVSNLTVSSDSGNISLIWEPVSGATGYTVYSSNNPSGLYSYETYVTETNWQTEASENMKFFYITSTNAKSPISPKTIEVKKK